MGVVVRRGPHYPHGPSRAAIERGYREDLGAYRKALAEHDQMLAERRASYFGDLWHGPRLVAAGAYALGRPTSEVVALLRESTGCLCYALEFGYRSYRAEEYKIGLALAQLADNRGLQRRLAELPVEEPERPENEILYRGRVHTLL